MKLLIPMDKDDTFQGQITDIFNATSWALIEMDGGNTKSVSFVSNYHEVIDEIDTLVIKNEYEPIMEFVEHEVMVLVAHAQKTIEEIIEAYIFKELRDLG